MANYDVENEIIDKFVRPYIILSIILGILLFISICGNFYLAKKKVDITLIAKNNQQSEVVQQNE